MKFNLKEYQKNKTKQYLKNNNLILLALNANQSSENWIITEQYLKKLEFNYYKVCNKTTKDIMKESSDRNLVNLINSTFFFLRPTSNNTQINKEVLQQFYSVLFTILAIRLNKKVYIISQAQNITSLNYKKNISILYQFLLTKTKLTHFNKTS